VSRRWVALTVLALAVLAVLVPIGRYEARRHAHSEMKGLRHVQALVGSLDSSRLDAYRVMGTFNCLLYRRGSDPFALELCFDLQGRLIEGIDRRSGSPRIWSLREDPKASTIRVDPNEVARLLRRMGAPS
jgi:hypothetical protein